MPERIVILHMGGQARLGLARRVREAGVYAELLSLRAPLSEIRGQAISGIILAGTPADTSASTPIPEAIFSLNVPVLAAGDGMPALVRGLGGTAEVSDLSANAVIENARRLYGVPEDLENTPEGPAILKKFLTDVCGLSCDYRPESLADLLIGDIRAQVGDKRVLGALSGGVDSSVASVLVHKAIGKQLTCLFVDHGLMRLNEPQEVVAFYRDKMGIDIIAVDARARFLGRLKGVTEPEQKRKIIGEEFIRVFEEEAKKLGGADFLLQGTIYPDIIESGMDGAATVKSHHNVGGLPEDIGFCGLVEPLKMLFKDEVRVLGESLGISHELVWRQPFPGPGLGVRVLGEITEEKLDILRKSDWILRDEIKKAGLDRAIWQYFTVFTGLKSVGMTNGARTYGEVIAIRAVTTTDAMTAGVAEIPYPLLTRIAATIAESVPGVNRVVYDVTGKPPGTVEWE